MIEKELTSGEKQVIYLISFVSLISFILILQSLSNSWLSNFDTKINLSIPEIRNNFFIEISKIIHYSFEPSIFIILFLVVICFLFYKKRKLEAISLTILTIITSIISQGIKILVHRPRPLNSLITETDFSFPSGHALMALVFFGTLVYLFEHHIKSRSAKRILIVLAALLVLLIGVSRLILNVHWFSDVLGSFALGIFLLCIYVLITNKISLFKKESS